jgi:hypothetical protein
MAGEIQARGLPTGQTAYALIHNGIGQYWNIATTLFENFTGANFANYAVSIVEQGSTGCYVGTFPPQITAGVYGIEARLQLGGSPAQSDPSVAGENFQWQGSAVLPLSALASSGQVSQILFQRIPKGVMIPNYPIWLVLATDHISDFVSGSAISGQIKRDAGNWGPLQSGSFTEWGFGNYTVTLTSGDLNGNSISVRFQGANLTGGLSDPYKVTFLTNPVSGS